MPFRILFTVDNDVRHFMSGDQVILVILVISVIFLTRVKNITAVLRRQHLRRKALREG